MENWRSYLNENRRYQSRQKRGNKIRLKNLEKKRKIALKAAQASLFKNQLKTVHKKLAKVGLTIPFVYSAIEGSAIVTEAYNEGYFKALREGFDENYPGGPVVHAYKEWSPNSIKERSMAAGRVFFHIFKYIRDNLYKAIPFVSESKFLLAWYAAMVPEDLPKDVYSPGPGLRFGPKL